MEASVSKEIKVGIFALLGVLAFLISILALGGDKLFFKSTYQLRVELSDVQGLARGSVVSLDGVPIGNVRNLNFISGSKNIEVVLDIYTDHQARITDGATASVKTQGALGDKYIYIKGGPLNAPPLAPGSLLRADSEGDLLDVITKRGAEFAQIIEVIKEVRELFHQINKDGRSARLMDNLAASSGGLKEALPHLNNILKKIDQGDGTLGALVNDPTLHNKLLQVFGGSTRNRFLTPIIRDTIRETEK